MRFGSGARLPVGEGEPARATFTLEVNEWNGVSSRGCVLRHAQPASQAPDSEPLPAGSEAEPQEELVLF